MKYKLLHLASLSLVIMFFFFARTCFESYNLFAFVTIDFIQFYVYFWLKLERFYSKLDVHVFLALIQV